MGTFVLAVKGTELEFSYSDVGSYMDAEGELFEQLLRHNDGDVRERENSYRRMAAAVYGGISRTLKQKVGRMFVGRQATGLKSRNLKRTKLAELESLKKMLRRKLLDNDTVRNNLLDPQHYRLEKLVSRGVITPDD